jgi:transcriptional regulator with XRE-family HTH domain
MAAPTNDAVVKAQLGRRDALLTLEAGRLLMVQGRRPNLPRRRAVLHLRQQGWTLPAIAARLGVTRQSVRYLLTELRRGSVRCARCHVTIPTLEGSARVVGVLCRGCLAAADVSFGQRLFSLRIAAGLTQAELARQARITTLTVSMAERGRHAPHRRTRERLFACLGPDLAPEANGEQRR